MPEYISEENIRRVERVAEDEGLDAVLAILVRWLEKDTDIGAVKDGLARVRGLAAHLTRAEVDELVPVEELEEEDECP